MQKAAKRSTRSQHANVHHMLRCCLVGVHGAISLECDYGGRPCEPTKLPLRACYCLIFSSLPNAPMLSPNTVEGSSRSVYRSHEVAVPIEKLREGQLAPATLPRWYARMNSEQERRL